MITQMQTMTQFTQNTIVAAAALLLLPALPADADLVGLWQFEYDFVDTSVEGNNGTGINGVTYTAGQTGYGQAGNFSGANTHVLVPHDASLDIASTGTFAAWVNAAGAAWEGILAKSPSSNGSGNQHAGNYELRLENTSQNIVFLHQQGGVNDTATVNSGVPAPSSNWHHVAVTVDKGANQVKFYLDGTLQSTMAAGATFGATNTNPLYLGSRADLFTDFNGQLDDVAIFNEVLDVTQINTIKNGDFSAFTSNITVPNFSFESGLNGWALSGGGGTFAGAVGQILPDDGGLYAFLETATGQPGTVTLTSSNSLGTVDIGRTYELTAAIGHRAFDGSGGRRPDDYMIELLVDGVAVASNTLADGHTNIPATEWLDLVASFTATSTGELTIRLTHSSDDPTFRQGAFDNIRLIAIPTPAALPAGLMMLGIFAARRRR